MGGVLCSEETDWREADSDSPVTLPNPANLPTKKGTGAKKRRCSLWLRPGTRGGKERVVEIGVEPAGKCIVIGRNGRYLLPQGGFMCRRSAGDPASLQDPRRTVCCTVHDCSRLFTMPKTESRTQGQPAITGKTVQKVQKAHPAGCKSCR